MVDPLFISSTDEVRRLARSVTTTDFTNPQIELQQKAAYSDLIQPLQKSDWVEGADNRFYSVQKMEQQLAAAYVLEHYGQGSPEEIALITALKTDVKDKIKEYKEATTDASADQELLLATSLYESYPASLQDDPNAIPYRSTNASV